MRITVTIDDGLLEKAGRLTGIESRSALLAEGLRVLVEQESARRLAGLGGSEPGLAPAPRRKDESA